MAAAGTSERRCQQQAQGHDCLRSSCMQSSPAGPLLLPVCRFFQTVRDQFLALLSAPDVSLAGLVEAMTRLLTERCAASTAQPRRMDGDLVSRMLSRIFSHEDPVYQRVCLLGPLMSVNLSDTGSHTGCAACFSSDTCRLGVCPQAQWRRAGPGCEQCWLGDRVCHPLSAGPPACAHASPAAADMVLLSC